MTNINSTQTQSLEEQLLNPAYRIDPEAFWSLSVLRGDDGYDRMDPARAHRWSAISSWGRNGWDLGSWPLVVMYHRTTYDAWQLAYNVEGDVTVYSYPSKELRDAATDCLAFWHWKHEEEDWVAGIESVDLAPDHLRGAFSWRRADEEQAS